MNENRSDLRTEGTMDLRLVTARSRNELVDSIGRSWPVEKALQAMDKKLVRWLGLSFEGTCDQESFSTYCAKHFIEHGTHFDPGGKKPLQRTTRTYSQPSSKPVDSITDPKSVVESFEQTFNAITKYMTGLQPRLKDLDLDELRKTAQIMNAALRALKQIEQLELQCMTASDFDEVLESEMSFGGVRSALSVGEYLIKRAGLNEPKTLAVARWLSECAQDECDRVLKDIVGLYNIRLRIDVVHRGLDWSHAMLAIEDEKRWIFVTLTPVDFNVLIGLVLGILVGKGCHMQAASNLFNALLFPLDSVDMCPAALSIAVRNMKRSAKSSN